MSPRKALATTAGTTPTRVIKSPLVEGVIFCDYVIDGMTVREACAESGVGWQQIVRWIAKDPDGFGQLYAAARKSAGTVWADRAYHVLEEATPESIVVDKPRSDYAKWRAGVNDRDQYGDRQKVDQDTTLRVIVEYVAPPILAPDTDA